jgi:hypothetical protein
VGGGAGTCANDVRAAQAMKRLRKKALVATERCFIWWQMIIDITLFILQVLSYLPAAELSLFLPTLPLSA